MIGKGDKEMQKRRSVTMSALLYTMSKKWKLMLLVFVIIAAVGTAAVIVTGKDKKGETVSSDTGVIAKDTDVKNREDLAKYKKYLEQSAYMGLDPGNLHYHYIYFEVVGKEGGPAINDAFLSKLLLWISPNTVSDDMKKRINSKKDDYKGKELQEVIGVSRSGFNIVFNIMYTDDYYVSDLSEVIKAVVKEKEKEWYSVAGEFTFVQGPEYDRTVDGYTAGIMEGQMSKRTRYATIEQTVEKNSVVLASGSTAKAASESKNVSRIVKLLVVALISLVAAIISGLVAALFDKHFNTSADVYDLTGEEVLCTLKSEPVKGLDRLFYRKDERFCEPELFLAMANKQLVDKGCKRAYLYNCSDDDVTEAVSLIENNVKEVEVIPVPDKNSKDFFLNAKEDEAVIILVKGGRTSKRFYARIRERLDTVGAGYQGTVFVL